MGHPIPNDWSVWVCKTQAFSSQFGFSETHPTHRIPFWLCCSPTSYSYLLLLSSILQIVILWTWFSKSPEYTCLPQDLCSSLSLAGIGPCSYGSWKAPQVSPNLRLKTSEPGAQMSMGRRRWMSHLREKKCTLSPPSVVFRPSLYWILPTKIGKGDLLYSVYLFKSSCFLETPS